MVDVTLTSNLPFVVSVNFIWEFGGKRVYLVVLEEGEEIIKERMTSGK